MNIQPIPFYRNGVLVKYKNAAWTQGKGCLWYVGLSENELVALDGSLANIHYLNFHGKLRVTKENCSDYLRFWFYFYKQSERRRYLSENTVAEEIPEQNEFLCDCLIYEEKKPYAIRLCVSSMGKVTVKEKNRSLAQPQDFPPDFSF